MTWYVCGVDARDEVTGFEMFETPFPYDAIEMFIGYHPETVAVWVDVVPFQDLEREPDFVRDLDRCSPIKPFPPSIYK